MKGPFIYLLKMKILKKYNILTLLGLHLLLILFIRNALYPIHFAHQDFAFPFELLVFLDSGNLLLLWLISRRIFSNYSFLPSLIYAVIPWSGYLVSAESSYIYLLSLLLLIFFIYVYFKSKRILGFVLIIPLFLGLKNVLGGEVKIFSDPGLLNMVNSYQGAAKEIGFGNLARISENKYLFFTEYVLLKYMKQLVPTTYFTSQEKLLNFSFSSPIYFGFLPPFLYGLYVLSKSPFLLRSILISTLLVIPSVLAKQMVDLNRLFIFSPVIIFVISYGLMKLYEQRKRTSFFLILTLILVIFQLVVTISDIQFKEKDRYIKYFGQDYEVGK